MAFAVVGVALEELGETEAAAAPIKLNKQIVRFMSCVSQGLGSLPAICGRDALGGFVFSCS